MGGLAGPNHETADLARRQTSAGQIGGFACHPEKIGVKALWASHHLAQAAIECGHFCQGGFKQHFFCGKLAGVAAHVDAPMPAT